MDTITALKNAIGCVGSQVALAKAIGNVPPSLVWQWLTGRRPIAAHHCIPIERAADGKVTRYDLRPDVFGDPPAIQASAAPDQQEAA